MIKQNKQDLVSKLQQNTKLNVEFTRMKLTEEEMNFTSPIPSVISAFDELGCILKIVT